MKIKKNLGYLTLINIVYLPHRRNGVVRKAKHGVYIEDGKKVLE